MLTLFTAPKSDIEQLKPGAGAGSKAVDVAEGTMPEIAASKQKKSMLRWRSAKADNGKSKEIRTPEPGGSNSLAVPPAQTERGKFVEHVSVNSGISGSAASSQ